MLSREDALEMLEVAEEQVERYEKLLMDVEGLLGSLGGQLVEFRHRFYDKEFKAAPITQAREAIIKAIGEDKFYALLKDRENG